MLIIMYEVFSFEWMLEIREDRIDELVCYVGIGYSLNGE